MLLNPNPTLTLTRYRCSALMAWQTILGGAEIASTGKCKYGQESLADAKVSA